MSKYPYVKRVVVVSPLLVKLQLFQEVERRMIAGTVMPFEYKHISDAIAQLQPIVEGVPLQNKKA